MGFCLSVIFQVNSGGVDELAPSSLPEERPTVRTELSSLGLHFLLDLGDSRVPYKEYSFVFSNNNTKYVILPWGVTVGEVVVISTFFFSVTSKEGWLVFLWWMRLLSPPPGEKVWRVVHWEEGSVVMAVDFLSALFLSCPWTSTYSTLSNKRTGMNYRILWKNLDQGSVIIFDQWKWFRLIDLVPGFTSYRGLGIKSINRNHFHWSEIITKPWSRFLFKIR